MSTTTWDRDDYLVRYAVETEYRRKTEEMCGPSFPQCWSCARLFGPTVRRSRLFTLLCCSCARLAASLREQFA
jgi:hypothetical protein